MSNGMNEFIERISKLSPKRLVLLAAELQARLQAAEQAAEQAAVLAAELGTEQAAALGAGEAIAVIGLGMRFPGGVQSPEDFWQFLLRGGDGIREVPPERWDINALFDADPDTPGKMASRWGGFVDGIDEFDPQFFGITPREAATMDPQQRMMLEVSWEALERAGYAPDRLAGSATGVFVGACNGDYYQMLLKAGDESGGENMDMYTSTGNAHSVISGRISYLLGLQGPSLTVDTACSSSLVAMHLACQSLRQGECRLALAGGVNAILSPDTTIALSKAKMMAPDGRCKAFDASADGFVRSEGCGVVVLKRLTDAFADGDQVLAVVRGSAINQDGRSNGLTAPNGPAQVAVITAALADAHIEPAQVGYVETHGTGTSLGDPLEVQALAEALGKDRAADRPLLIGSVKTNLGHLESAAGVAGFIKLVLTLQHKTIPPHLHLKQLNPYVAWDELPVRVPPAGGAWEPLAGRWLGGVSSFGFSGTNVHMVLEAAPQLAADPAAGSTASNRSERPLHLIQLSARSAAALQAQARSVAAFLGQGTADAVEAEAALADIAFTANCGRALFAHRLAIVAASRAEAQAQLAAFAEDRAGFEGHTGHVPSQRKPQVAFLFSGHGGQYAGMGSQLYATEPVFRRAYDRCDELFRTQLGRSLLDAFTLQDDGGAPAWMESMGFAQPALFALQYALAQMWRSWGIEPNAVLGHSLGEYAAACVAGVLRLEDAVKLVAARSRLMDALPPGGVMYAVFAPEEQVSAAVAPYGDRAAIAAINGPQTTVISGTAEAVEAVVATLAQQKIRSRRLAVAQGAHSPLIDGVLDEFEAVAATVNFNEPQIALVSSLYGRVVQPGEVTNADYWRRHLRQPVRFADAMAALYADGNDVFIEIGPNPTLIAMGQRCLPAEGTEGRPSGRPIGLGVWAPSLRQGSEEWRQVLDSAAALFVYGVGIDWAAVDRHNARRRVAFPTYPFDRQRYWFRTTAVTVKSSRSRRAAKGTRSQGHPLVGEQLRSPALQDFVFETQIGREQPAYLSHHSIFGVVILPSPAYLEMALRAAQVLFGGSTHGVENFTIHAPLLLPAEEVRTVQLIVRPPDGALRTSFQVVAWEEEGRLWKLHATGEIVWQAAETGAASGHDEGDGPFQPASLQLSCPYQIAGSDYYAQVRELGLTFGDSFQGIRQVWVGDGEALGHIVLSPALADEAPDYRFHPALLDACFHLLGAPLAKGGLDAAYLLIGIDRFELYASPGGELWNHTRLVQHRGQPGGGGGETFTGDIELYDVSGRLVAAAQGLHLKRADRATLLRAVGQRPTDWIYNVAWQPQPRTASVRAADATGSGASSWLIFADEGDIATRLAALLMARGDRCTLVVPGAELAWQDDGWQIDPLDPAQFQALLTRPGMPPASKIIFLWGYGSAAPAAAEQAAAGLLHLVQALVRQGAASPAAGAQPALWVGTCEAQLFLGPPSEAGIRQAPLWGFGRVIALEQPQIWGGLVDLEGGDAHTAAQQLLAEVDAEIDAGIDAREDQVAWRDGVRYVARLQRGGVPAPRQVTLVDDAAYLVTGGLGGLGLEVARWLVEHGARHLVLIGRRGLPPREQWPGVMAGGAEGEALAEQVQAVQQLEDRGATVTVLAADVSDRKDMADLFARFGIDLPPLHGIVHAAADLSSAPLTDLDLTQVNDMLRPKVTGTLLLHELSAHLDLDFFVLFSSTTALLGVSGLAHYAAANAFLDAFAHFRHGLGLPALSINWGTWSVMRAASAAERSRAAVSGLAQMVPEQALALMGDCLADPDLVQVVIAAVDWGVLKPAYEARRRRPFLAAMEVRPVLPAAAFAAAAKPSAEVTPDLLAQYRAAAPEDRGDLLVAALRQAVAAIVGAPDPAALDVHQGLFEMGMDSLMSVELKTRLERQVGCALPSTLTFNYPTIADLAGYLQEQVLAVGFTACEPEAPRSANPTVPALQTPAAAGSTAANGDIDTLSEDELAERLMERLRQLQREEL